MLIFQGDFIKCDINGLLVVALDFPECAGGRLGLH
jgi:hypothetical protein